MPRWWRSRTRSPKPARIRYRQTDRRIWNKAARILRSNGQAYLDMWLARQKFHIVPAAEPAAVRWPVTLPAGPYGLQTGRPVTVVNGYRLRAAPWDGWRDLHVWVPASRPFAGILAFTCAECGLTRGCEVLAPEIERREKERVRRADARYARRRPGLPWRTFERQRELGKLRYRRPEPARPARRPSAIAALAEVYGA